MGMALNIIKEGHTSYLIVWNNLREFGFKLSVIAAPLREASLVAKRGNVVGASRLLNRSNATFFGIPCVSPGPGRV